MSGMCQPVHRSNRSFDHSIGGGEERWRNGGVESLRGLEVDHLIELDRHLDRQAAWLGALCVFDAIQTRRKDLSTVFLARGLARTLFLWVGEPDGLLMVGRRRGGSLQGSDFSG
jgi:hypothetical protein